MKSWDESYNLLKDFLKENNGNFPKTTEIYKGHNLGAWLHIQRSIFNNGVLLEDGSMKYKSHILRKSQIEKLEDIKFPFKTIFFIQRWEFMFELLRKYLKENNNIFPTYDIIYEEEKLGSWVSVQRHIRSNGILQKDGSIKYDGLIMTSRQKQLLDSINFPWMSIIYDDKWNKNYNLLVKFKNEFNRFPYSTEIYEDNPLGSWVSSQRIVFRRGTLQEDGSIQYNSHYLTKEQIEKLNAIDFDWIVNKTVFTRRTIKKHQDYLCIKRVLLCNLNKLLQMEENKIFEDYNDIKIINEKLIKTLIKEEK